MCTGALLKGEEFAWDLTYRQAETVVRTSRYDNRPISYDRPYSNGQAIIFCSCGYYLSFFFFFPRLFSAVGVGCLLYFHRRCGLTATLECMSEMCCMCLAANRPTRRKNYAKKSPSAHHCKRLSGYIFVTKACIDNRKNCQIAISPPHVLTICELTLLWPP